ncbi:hypothetical protein AVEN_193878-1 [Araneus ventricosus]|uniref:Uncharacterized protein n=1 Tax=Araneus ventricosus TaxID=182803 RepID=A0A4Y2PGR8_ARAVE|nr:hypothetical protein AVEN_193878-1 [Araneus ventricosus]
MLLATGWESTEDAHGGVRPGPGRSSVASLSCAARSQGSTEGDRAEGCTRRDNRSSKKLRFGLQEHKNCIQCPELGCETGVKFIDI